MMPPKSKCYLVVGPLVNVSGAALRYAVKIVGKRCRQVVRLGTRSARSSDLFASSIIIKEPVVLMLQLGIPEPIPEEKKDPYSKGEERERPIYYGETAPRRRIELPLNEVDSVDFLMAVAFEGEVFVETCFEEST